MRKKKESGKIQNDRCFACQHCVWNEETDKYSCSVTGCRNNNKFEIYRPSWMRGDSDASKNC